MQDFFARAQAAPDRVVLVMAETAAQHTAGALARQALQMAQWLAAQGLQPGERFAVLLENRVEILALVLAARQAGLYAAVLSTHLTPDEVAYIVGDSGARLVIASAKTLSQLEQPQAARPLPCWTVDAATAQAPSLSAALAALQGPPVDFSDRPMGRDLLYSSGTTGRPKGVLKPLWPASQRGQADPEAQVTARLMAMGEDTVYLS
ncbi:MAG TPA: AMP-binding protein, partial [Alicycliphilus sp.]|nr:AMP-binding protein [Alicycliphilus sp.]